MKKRKFNILLNIAVLCMCVAAIAIGVYSAKTASLNVSGTIGFTAHNCKVRVLGKITGAVDSSNNALPESTASLNYQESASTGKLIDGTSDSWNFGKIYFDDLNVVGNAIATDIVFTFTLTNESAYDVVATLNVDKLPDSIQPKVAFSSGSNNSGFVCELKKEKTPVTMTLTLKLLTSEQIQDATNNIDLSLSFERVNQNQIATALGYTFSDGNILGVPATSETNATLNIPSYFYDTTNNKVAFIEKIVPKLPNILTNANLYSTIAIPNSITYIGYCAFAGFTNLTSINIPNSVTYIGYGTFSNCTGLTSITISNNVNYLDYSMFSGCTSLTSINIPDSVTSIGMEAFSGCTSLTTITIPNSVSGIGESAFEGCTSLTSINIPDNVTYIDFNAFSGCTSLTTTIGDGWINSTFQKAVSPSTLLKDITYSIKRQQ